MTSFGIMQYKELNFCNFFSTLFDTYIKKPIFVINHLNYETTNLFLVAFCGAAGCGAG